MFLAGNGTLSRILGREVAAPAGGGGKKKYVPSHRRLPEQDRRAAAGQVQRPAAADAGLRTGRLAGHEISIPVSDRDEACLVVSDRDDDGLGDRIAAGLIAFNAEMTGYRAARPVIATVWDGEELLAGLYGGTWGGSAYIELLWVRSDCRRLGLGRRLLHAGESEFRRRGCDRVALSTFSFQAPAFYRREGYATCGVRTAFPHGHDQILMTKVLG